VSLADLAKQLERLLQSQLLMRCPAVSAEDPATAVPVLTVVNVAEMFSLPKLDIKVMDQNRKFTCS
jgi:hypothetical protein